MTGALEPANTYWVGRALSDGHIDMFGVQTESYNTFQEVKQS